MHKTHITKIPINQDSRYTPLTNRLVSDIPEGVVSDKETGEILTWKRRDGWLIYTYLPGTSKKLTEEYSTGAWTVYTYDKNDRETSREDDRGWKSNIPLKPIHNKELREMFSHQSHHDTVDRMFFRIATGVLYCPITDYYDCRGFTGSKKDVMKRMPHTAKALEDFDPRRLIEMYRKEVGK